MRSHLVRARSREVHSVKSILRSYGLVKIYRSLGNDKAWQKLLKNPLLPASIKELVQSHYRVWSVVAEQVKAMEDNLSEHGATRAAVLKRLQDDARGGADSGDDGDSAPGGRQTFRQRQARG